MMAHEIPQRSGARREIHWLYRIGTLPKPFDPRCLLASRFIWLLHSSRSSLLLASRFFSLLASSRSSLLLASTSSRSSLSLLTSSRFSFLLAFRFFSLHASSLFSLLLASRFLTLHASSRFFCVWQSRPGNGGVVGFSYEGLPYESDWPSLGRSWFCFSSRFSSVRGPDFSARRGG